MTHDNDVLVQDRTGPTRDTAIPKIIIPDEYALDHEEVIVKPKKGLFGCGRRDGVWRTIAYRKNGPSYWRKVYTDFSKGSDARVLVASAGALANSLAARDGSSQLVLDLLKPRRQVPKTGPTGAPLLDLTDGRPDTTQSIALNIIVDQDNPFYEEYLHWVQLNRHAFDRDWMCLILDHVRQTSQIENIRTLCSSLFNKLKHSVDSKTPAHIIALRTTAEEATTMLLSANGPERYSTLVGQFPPGLQFGHPPHRRAWYDLRDMYSSSIDISGGVFDDLVIDVDLSRVVGRSASFRNCIFLCGYLAYSNFDDADFTGAWFTGLGIQGASLRRAILKDAYVNEYVNVDSATRLDNANVCGLRIHDRLNLEGVGDEFINCLSVEQRRLVAMMPETINNKFGLRYAF